MKPSTRLILQFLMEKSIFPTRKDVNLTATSFTTGKKEAMEILRDNYINSLIEDEEKQKLREKITLLNTEIKILKDKLNKTNVDTSTKKESILEQLNKPL